MRVFVAAGTGVLGQRLVPQLAVRGHRVTATTTSPGKLDLLNDDDEPAPSRGWLPHLAACAGAKTPMRVPKGLARLLARDVAVLMMTEGRGFSHAKAKRELGWEPRYPSWRVGFEKELT